MDKTKTNQIIWDSFRHGDKKALEIIYEENYTSLFHYGLKFINDEEVIKDLIHELFVNLIDSGTKLSSTNNIRFYLLKVLRNKIVSHKSITIQIQDQHNEFTLLESIESQLIKKEVEAEIQEQILSSIRKLSVKQQEIIYLRFYNDMPYKSIAELFDVNIQTVRNLMNRAITSLKDDLSKKRINRSSILFVLSLPI